MTHRAEIETIVAQVSPWPMEERVALVNEILGGVRQQTRQPAPRQTLQQAIGIARGAAPPPDDAMVQRWIEEHRLQKHG